MTAHPVRALPTRPTHRRHPLGVVLTGAALTVSLVACTAGSPTPGGESPATGASAASATETAPVATPPASPATPDVAATGAPDATPAGADPRDTPGGLHPELVYVGRPDGSSSYQLSGLVVDVVDDGGTCMFVLRRGTAEVRREVPAAPDAASTTCGTVEVPASELTAGTWEATLSYDGPAGRGTSAATAVTVP